MPRITMHVSPGIVAMIFALAVAVLVIVYASGGMGSLTREPTPDAGGGGAVRGPVANVAEGPGGELSAGASGSRSPSAMR